MFGFGSKIFCNLKQKKVKKKTARSCSDFMASIPPAGVNPAQHALTVMSKKYKPTCDHCSYNKSFK